MELIERYLQAVKFWLPSRQKDDIAAELSEDIHAQVEEREAALGRSLSEAEIEDLLKQRGHPLVLANSFQPQQYLIGPVLFPIYRFVVKVFALGFLAPSALVWIGLMVFSPAFRAGHTHPFPFAPFNSLFSSLWIATCLFITPLTIAFAALERNKARILHFESWNPRKLPSVRNPNKIPRASSSIELAVNLIFLLWWAAYLHTPEVQLGSVLRIHLSALWPWFFWSYLLLAAANAAFATANLMHPYWTAQRASFRLLTEGLGAGLFCWLMKANILAGIDLGNASTEQALALAQAINAWMARWFPVAVAVGCIVVATAVYRIVRTIKAGTNPPL